MSNKPNIDVNDVIKYLKIQIAELTYQNAILQAQLEKAREGLQSNGKNN